ncbi:MAG: DUF839 domain-containing protein [Planctomycetes bacterium]|nr:DUF839 domain-containing protein [Planctomycetota bacterium]
MPRRYDLAAVPHSGEGTRRCHGLPSNFAPRTSHFAPRTAGEAAQPGSLELFIEPNDPSAVESCDNLTVAPWGDLILCEDAGGGGVVPGHRLVGVTPQGRCYQFELNAQNKSEFAGACFSPDGATLFANIRDGPARTLAISGPWTK